MGLDQYLYDSIPNPLNPYDHGTEIGYWRKDWNLQDYIGTDNCEPMQIDLDYCNQILNDLDFIYDEISEDSYRNHTLEVFTKARQILLSGGRIIYCADW